MQTQRALQFTPEELEHPLFGARAFWSGRDIGSDFDDRLERRLAWILAPALRGSAPFSVGVALGRWVQGRISILRQRRALASSKVYLFGLYYQAVFGRSY